MDMLAFSWVYACRDQAGNKNPIRLSNDTMHYRLETTLSGMSTWQEVLDINGGDHLIKGHNIMLEALRDNTAGGTVFGRYRWQLGEGKFVNIVVARSATGEASSELPVPLDRLFPDNPNPGSVDFNLATDKTWESVPSSGNLADANPSESVFGFYVITSPANIQVSLDKRDNSPWELFNCYDNGEKAHTIQMVCSDESESSTTGCGQIHLGEGVPGTILEMPEGCGPGRYAVAVNMIKADMQDLPPHLSKRFAHGPAVYNLTFDYDFRRVPRQAGEESHLRIDFSNHVGYWDAIVNATAGSNTKKSKRAFDGRNHKRWLEDQWRDDVHINGISIHELHRRWFGSGILDWLKKLVQTFASPSLTHNIDHKFTAKIVDQKSGCNIRGVNVESKILAEASVGIHVETTFGISIITKLTFPLDLSQSYVYFANKGSIDGSFKLEGSVKANYQSGDKV